MPGLINQADEQGNIPIHQLITCKTVLYHGPWSTTSCRDDSTWKLLPGGCHPRLPPPGTSVESRWGQLRPALGRAKSAAPTGGAGLFFLGPSGGKDRHRGPR